MLKYLIILLIMLFFGAQALANERNDLEERYIETLALTFQGFAEQGRDPIWPHFDLTDSPAVFHFQNGHVYAFGLIRYSSLWEKRLIQHYPVLFCSQYPISLVPIHPNFSFEGQRAFVFSLDYANDTPFLPLLTFIHERFHIYQFRFFYKEKVIDAVLTDYQNVDLLAWMELEQHLLTFFLQAKEPEIKLQHLKNYLAVSHMRRQALHSASIKWEDHQQKMEGLADYVSVKTFQVFPYISNFNAEEFLLKMRQKKNKGVISSTQDAMKGRHYFVGAALGWALDFCGAKNWKSRIEKEEISLQAMLEHTLYMDEQEKQERQLYVQEALDWIGIRKQIKQQMDKEQKKNEEIVQTFVAQEGVVIRMGTPSGHMSSGGRHQKMYQVDRTKVLIGDTSVATSQDQSWTLRFQGIPLVFEEQNGDRMFKLHPQTLLQLNGKEISFEELLQWNFEEVPFLSLSLKNEYCELDSKRSGKLCIDQNGILFKFN